MNERVALVMACLAGGGLGAFFFGGLWWTVRKAVASKWAPLWFFGSLMVRTLIALAGFYLVSNGHWKRLLVCLLGFVLARLAVARLARQFWVTGES